MQITNKNLDFLLEIPNKTNVDDDTFQMVSTVSNIVKQGTLNQKMQSITRKFKKYIFLTGCFYNGITRVLMSKF